MNREKAIDEFQCILDGDLDYMPSMESFEAAIKALSVDAEEINRKIRTNVYKKNGYLTMYYDGYKKCAEDCMKIVEEVFKDGK